jgi:signal transduction histidine kinase
MRLILYRALAAAVIAVVLLLWVYPAATAFQQMLMTASGALFMLLLLIQTSLTASRVAGQNQLVFQYASDTALASMLIFASGGVFSPFSFLYGLIIIASGSHARRMLPIVISLLACSGYLSAVYGEAWLSRVEALDTQQALHVLLQVSALLLVGGVMAYIARRHAALRARSDRAVRQHRKLKDLHDQIMAEMAEGVIVLDRDLQVSDMNSAARVLLGQRSVATLLAYPPLAGFFSQTTQPDFQCEYDDPDDAQRRTLLLAVRPLSADADAAWLLTLVDISEIRRLERQLLQQEKMALLGKMAAMLAHEIRNPIQTMAQGLEIMAARPDSREAMQTILHDETRRLNRLVTIMLDYARPLHPSPSPTDMAALIRQALTQLEVDCREQLRWRCDVDELLIDSDHFRLVLDNLLCNAVANSSDGSGRDIEIALSADARNWLLQVYNDGALPDEIRDQLFEPFVTGRSGGMGLGLAIVRQVCMANGWREEANDRDGRVCFRVCAPLQADRAECSDGKEATHG